MLADTFENFWNMFLEIYELDLARFLAAPGFALEAALKMTKVKLDLLTDIDMFLRQKNVSREEYIPLFIEMQKRITNT